MQRNPYTPTSAALSESPDLPGPAGPRARYLLGPRIILAVGWLVICGGYTIWAALRDHQWQVMVLGALVGASVIFAAIGALLLRWRWSRWIVFTFVVWGSVVLLNLFWQSYRAGYFPLETAALTALSLVPGLFVLSASIWSADVVRRRFRVPKR